MYKTIVLGLDGSDGSARAVPHAVELAKAGGGKVVAVYVEEELVGKGAMPGPREEEMRSAVDSQVEGIRGEGVDVSLESRTIQLGGPGHVIAEVAESAGADVIVATGENEPARVRSALDQLGAAGISSILLEGGPRLAGAFLDAGEVDEIRLFVAPVVVGGSSARDPLEGTGVERIAEATRALTLECARVADDVLISARLREW